MGLGLNQANEKVPKELMVYKRKHKAKTIRNAIVADSTAHYKPAIYVVKCGTSVRLQSYQWSRMEFSETYVRI